MVVGTLRPSNEWRQPPAPHGFRGPSLKSTALAHPPLRWEAPGSERGGPRVACCKGHHQLTTSALTPSARLFWGVLAWGQGSRTQQQEPRSHVCEPRCQQGALGAILGPSPASSVARNPLASLAGDASLRSLPQPAHVPSSPPPLPFVSLCLSSAWRTRGLNPGLRGFNLRPG